MQTFFVFHHPIVFLYLVNGPPTKVLAAFEPENATETATYSILLCWFTLSV
jgi:hypothetical protein